MSACTGGCATTWPPLTVTSAGSVTGGTGVTGRIGTMTRADGTLQVTYNGAPLYFYSGDAAAGDAHGQGIGGVWFAATAGGGSAAASPAASQPTNAGSGAGYGGY